MRAAKANVVMRVEPEGEATLALHVRAEGLLPPEREYRFHDQRAWRADFAWPELRLLVEVEGLTAAGGRHQRIAGYTADLEKYNAAALAGWRVLRFTPRQVARGDAIRILCGVVPRREAA